MTRIDLYAILLLSALGDLALSVAGYRGWELVVVPLLCVALPFAGFALWRAMDLSRMARRIRIMRRAGGW